MLTEFEIYWKDLTKDCQRRLLDAGGLKTPEEANWGYWPIATVILGEDE